MIGIISDTHDNMDAIRTAVEFFNSKNVEIVLHAGDLISPFTVNEFKKLNSKFYAVFGNNEGEREGLRKKFDNLCKLSDFLELDYKGIKISVYHGTIPFILNALAESQIYDIIVTGHTHRPEIKRIENTLIVNPGECCGYLTGKRTIALLNTENMSVEIIEI